MAPVHESYLPVRGVDGGDARSKLQVDIAIAIELRRAQRNPRLRCVAREIVLGKIRPIVRDRFIRAQHRDTTGVAFAAKRFGRGVTGCATPDDDHRGRHRRGRSRRPRADHVELAANESLSIPLLDAPARHRVERRRAQRLPSSQAEARVMPRAADRLAHDEPGGERATVMRARRADGEQFRAAANQDQRLALRVAEKYLSVGRAGKRHALCEIGAFEFRFWLAHGVLHRLFAYESARVGQPSAARAASGSWDCDHAARTMTRNSASNRRVRSAMPRSPPVEAIPRGGAPWSRARGTPSRVRSTEGTG